MCMSFGVGLGFEPASIEDTVNNVVDLVEAGKERAEIIEEMMTW